MENGNLLYIKISINQRENLYSEVTQMAVEYISEIINDEYQQWQSNDTIFITASTGAGKSYFILHTFLEWQIRKGKRTLYLVNRRILAEQLKQELVHEISYKLYRKFGSQWGGVDHYITITTYQGIEKGLIGNNPFEVIQWLSSFDCVVCDECHYFYTDSNFNTRTELSYLAIQEVFDTKLQIYLSATPDKIKTSKERYLMNRKMPYYPNPEQLVTRERHPIKEYSAVSDIAVNLHIIDKDIDIITEVTKNTHMKWLIFVDNIERGKSIQKVLRHNTGMEEDEIIFLDADYENNKEAEKSVRELVENKKSSKKVVISTAVIDNGVTFQDNELTHIAVLADTKETFLQMLGRKRRNENERIELYICKRNLDYFEKRLKYTELIQDIFFRSQMELQYLYALYFVFEAHSPDADYNSYFHRNDIHYVQALRECARREGVKYCQKSSFIQQQDILDKLIFESGFGCLKRFCCSVGGIITYNQFSVERLADLREYYTGIIQELEMDEDAFVKCQCRWMKIPDDKVTEAIKCFHEDLFAKCRRILESAIKKILIDKEGHLTAEENKDWKKEVKEQLAFFVKQGKTDGCSVKGSASWWKPDRNLTPEIFNFCMEEAELPYEMKKLDRNANYYCIIQEKLNQIK